MAMHTMRDKYTVMQNITKNVLLRNTIHSAEKLICVSEFSKKELLNYYPKVENKIEVIYEGVNIPEIYINSDVEAKVLERFNIIEDIGAKIIQILNDKNLQKELIKKASKSKVFLLEKGCKRDLWFILGDGPERNELEKIAKPNVKFLGRLSDEEIREYYSTCKAFIYL